VPKVVGKRLARATRMLHSAHCTLGSVKRVRSKRKKGIVVAERPAAGTTLPANGKVSLKVSRGRR